MRLLAIFLLTGALGLLPPPPGASPQTASGDTADLDEAYLDGTAARLIRGARAARRASLLQIDSYTAILQRRFMVEAPSFRRSRALVGGEYAARLRWSRTEPTVVRVLGSRLRFPAVAPEARPAFYEGMVPRASADPLGDPFSFGLVDFIADSFRLVRSPLEEDAERYYQFRSGDTISIGLPSGRSVRAISVTAIPRHRSIHLVAAKVWIEPESFGIVRAAYRLAKKVDREARFAIAPGFGLIIDFDEEIAPFPVASDGEEEGDSASRGGRRRGFLSRMANRLYNGMAPPMEIDVSTVVVDYALWDFRQWLPRGVRAEGYFAVGDEVSANDEANLVMGFSREWTFTIEEVRFTTPGEAAGDPLTSRELVESWMEEGDSVRGDLDEADPRTPIIIVPENWADPAGEEFLPPPLWNGEPGGMSREEAHAIAAELARIGTTEGGGAGASPWVFEPPLWTIRLLRYNRVEGLSAGTRLRRDFPGWRSVLTARVGSRRLEPDLDLTLERDRGLWRARGSLYHSLLATDLDDGGLAQSADGLFSGRDSADYHVATGASLEFLPGRHERRWISLLFFAERQETFLPATTLDRAGAVLRWKPWRSRLSPLPGSGGGDLYLRATGGERPNLRAAFSAALHAPLPGRWFLGLEGGTARTWGNYAATDLWYVGGTGDWLRGYPARALVASSVRRGRIELQRQLFVLRGSLFGDWAAAEGTSLYSAGAGLSLWDGTIRADLARGLSSRRDPADPEALIHPGWRFHLRGDVFF